jgi:hypothetical protein
MMVMFGIFGAVLLFGFSSLLTGIWHAITGRRNLQLIWIMLGLGIALFIGAKVILAVFA